MCNLYCIILQAVIEVKNNSEEQMLFRYCTSFQLCCSAWHYRVLKHAGLRFVGYNLYNNHYNDLFSFCVTCFGLTLGPSSRATYTNRKFVAVFWVWCLLTEEDRAVRLSAVSFSSILVRKQETATNCRFVHVPLEDGLNISPKHVRLRLNK
jgi:hypothetical protein